ncbi:PaaI family thioesterase [Coraliomargarita parva]|uniref:PaaI family thioesterase n=1 Tax=Coraliomargarita parva TaxID=3014050 RepID=UPI0022B4FD7A|nr:PaaI family thioesterase [Coraliomargarita parva]
MLGLRTAASVLKLHRLRQLGHDACLACTHPDLKLDFTLDGPHRLRSSIDFTKAMTSFNGMVHGGLLAFVMDEAMTCALMAEGIYGATGDLNLRYRKPVRVGPTSHITVSISQRHQRLFRLEAELRQSGELCTTAKARFMETTLLSPEERAKLQD